MKMENLSHSIGYLMVAALISLTAYISGCVTMPETQGKADKQDAAAEKKKLSREEQEKKSLEAFNKILDLTSGSESREAILPRMEAMYEEIIKDYPDVPLVEESYWKLITIEVEEFKPPKIDKAEKLYGDFLKMYPGSALNIYLEHTFGRYFQANKMWDRILKVFSPHVKKFIQTGKLERPYPMLIYSEAKFNLNDLTEAEKGFKIVAEFFPRTAEGDIARKKMSEIQELKKKTGGS